MRRKKDRPLTEAIEECILEWTEIIIDAMIHLLHDLLHFLAGEIEIRTKMKKRWTYL
jgi:hypothetical protein